MDAWGLRGPRRSSCRWAVGEPTGADFAASGWQMPPSANRDQSLLGPVSSPGRTPRPDRRTCTVLTQKGRRFRQRASSRPCYADPTELPSTWDETQRSNGRATHSTPGGAAPRFLRRVIIATQKLGPGAPVLMSGAPIPRGGASVTPTGASRFAGIRTPPSPAGARVCSARLWRTCSNRTMLWTTSDNACGSSSSVRRISTGCCSRSGRIWPAD